MEIKKLKSSVLVNDSVHTMPSAEIMTIQSVYGALRLVDINQHNKKFYFIFSTLNNKRYTENCRLQTTYGQLHI